MTYASSGQPDDLLAKCNEWLEQCSLLVTTDIREQFRIAINKAHSHRGYLAIHADSDLITRNFADIEAVGSAIERAFTAMVGQAAGPST